MNKELFLQIMEEIRQYLIDNKSSRLGQAFFNVFYNHFPNEVNQIRATSNDCFYRNNVIPLFINEILFLTDADDETFNVWYNSIIYNKLKS